jgi:hypothetical protein
VRLPAARNKLSARLLFFKDGASGAFSEKVIFQNFFLLQKIIVFMFFS